MNYDIYIENLGAIREANITITPLTILAGENGTGKSFVTKFLYSILNVINTNIYAKKMNSTISQITRLLEKTLNNEDLNLGEIELIELNSFKKTFDTLKSIINEKDFLSLDNVDYSSLIDIIQKYSLLFKEHIIPTVLNKEIKSKESDIFLENLKDNIGLKGDLSNFIFKIEVNAIPSKLEELVTYLKSPIDTYIELTKESLQNELKENFQISELKDLIKFGESECIFKVNELIDIIINTDNDIHIKFDQKYFEKITQINRLVFFESPVYWRLLTLINEDNRSYKRLLSKEVNDEKLSGVPKHFLDLKELLFTNFKDGERPSFIIESANNLKKQLKGSFESNNNDLIFQNLEGQSISKSLVSFGMTNIGIIQAVLSKNIINKGAFMFIDEPESNLHPEWQAVLANVLVQLAKNGVYVIITTHSSDMLKAFDISIREQKVIEELSTYYLKSDGKLLNMTDDKFSPIEMARRKLLETYEELMMRGYFL